MITKIKAILRRAKNVLNNPNCFMKMKRKLIEKKFHNDWTGYPALSEEQNKIKWKNKIKIRIMHNSYIIRLFYALSNSKISIEFDLDKS